MVTSIQDPRRSKRVSSSRRYVYCQKGHTARDCKSRFDSGDSSARGCWSSQAVGTLGILQGNANKAGQSFSVAAIYFQ